MQLTDSQDKRDIEKIKTKIPSIRLTRSLLEDLIEIIDKQYVDIKSQNEMAEKLNVSNATVSDDVKAIMENSDKKLNELVRKMMPFMYEKSIMGINEVLRECWRIYNSEDPRINQWHKQAALRLGKDCNKDLFELFSEGPVWSKLRDAGKELQAIIEDAGSKGYISKLECPILTDTEREII